MAESPRPFSPLRALAPIAAIAVAAAIGIIALSDGGETTVDASVQAAGSEPPAETERPDPRSEERGRTKVERPTLSIDELRFLAPDEHELAELERQDFERLGGIDSPGAAPDGARQEVDRPGWSDAMEEELRGGLQEMVVNEGVTVSRIECERGRCLVELEFRDMLDALDGVDSVRRWAGERVRCRSYSEGPMEGDTPSMIPSQQIWILCGQPSAND